MAESKHYILGMTKVKENDFEAAVAAFTDAIAENPNDVESYSERGVCYLHLKKMDLSMFDMNKAVELEPNYSYRYSCRAFIKSAMKDYKGAVEDYEHAIQLDPDDIVAHNNLGIALENLGYYEKAQEKFQKSNELMGYNPEDKEIVGNIAVDKDKAEEYRKKLAEEEARQEAKAAEDEKTENKKKRKRVIMNVFTKKGEFRNFMKFIGSGFKIKDDKKGES